MRPIPKILCALPFLLENAVRLSSSRCISRLWGLVAPAFPLSLWIPPVPGRCSAQSSPFTLGVALLVLGGCCLSCLLTRDPQHQ